MGEAKARERRGEAVETIHQLRITLLGTDPPVWRRVRVEGETTLAELHELLQAVMPWDHSHLHQFVTNEAIYSPPRRDDFGPLLGPPDRDESTARLRRIAPAEDDVFYYEYDFGDSWEHEIVVERRLPPVEGERYPVCLAAERACPPDDSGGVWGYERWIEAFDDPNDPDHEDAVEWLGEDFDPEAVDVDAINRRLTRLGGGRIGEATARDEGREDRDGRGYGAAAGGNGRGAGVTGDGTAEPAAEADARRGRFDDVRAMARDAIEQAMRENPEATLDDLNALLATRTDAYNRTPQPELLGVSPNQVRALLYDDWTGDGAIRFDDSLPLDALEPSRLFRNARAFLALIDEQDGFKATQAGNLNRATVAAVLDRLDLPEGYLDDLHEYNKVINEQDARELHVLRVLLELGGLIRHTRGRFRITPRGRSLLEPDRAGELFAHLFRTHFTEFNLAYLDGMPEAPALQHSVGFTLYRFGRLGDWREPEELARETVLPTILDEIPKSPPAWGEDRDWLPSMLRLRVLEPLVDFGLAEVREEPGEYDWSPRRFYRPSALYGTFLSFEFGETGG